MDVKLLTFNVIGINNILKRRQVSNYLHAETIDIVCLQETC